MRHSFRRRVRRWWWQVPHGDEVTRRNGIAMQLLLVFIGSTVPLVWPYHILIVGTHLKPTQWLDVATDALICVVAWIGVYLIRRGRVIGATRLFIGALLLSLATTYVCRGLSAALLDQTYVVLTIVVGGLILGRRTLWRLYATLLGIFSIGAAMDVWRLFTLLPDRPWIGAANLVPLAMSYFAITVVLDQCVSSLRRSINEADARGAALARANEALKVEIKARDEARQQLLHAQKVEAVGRLAGGIAHDFNNVLSVIAGYAGTYEETDDGEIMRSALVGIAAAARRGGAISRKLLSFSRSDVTRMEVFDLGVALLEMKPVLRQLLSHETVLTIDVGNEAHHVRFDRDQLELLVLNIAVNARDAMRVDGHFTITLAGSMEGVELQFADDGHGMSDNVREHIFEAFYTTKPADRGSGLGLAVVHDLITAAGGNMRVQSALGQGTRFIVDLPTAIPTMALMPVARGPVHTLLIEDDDELRDMWCSRLEAEGFLVIAAASAESGLRVARGASSSLELVITDMRLGDNDPATWLRTLQGVLPGVPVLVISSHVTGTQDPSPLVSGLAKPCSLDAMVSAARHALVQAATGDTAPASTR